MATALLAAVTLFAQPGEPPGLPVFGPSYRLYPSAVNQTEVFIEKSPVNPDILWASCNTLNFIPFFISEGIYTTVDGGASWQGSDTCSGTPIAYHGGDPGITITPAGTFILARMGRAPFTGLYSHYSTDNGLTWSSQKAISTDDLERAALAANTQPGTPGYGRVTAGWVKFAWPFPMMIAQTDDGAKSWSEPRQLNNPSQRCAGGDIAVGPGGEIYICWAGVTDQTPFKEVHAGFALSLNGGADWTVTENAFAMNGITGILPGKANIRVNGLPDVAVDVTEGPRRGWIYIVTGEKDLAPAGSDPDIVLHRSTDGGQTWSEGIRVNRDPLNNGKTQYFPAIHIDGTGAVNILFYDDRNTTADSASVFLARSTDGGDTFTEFEISGHRFKPVPIGGLGQGYQGDNIDLTSTADKLWPVWMDNSTGVYQVWTSPLRLSEIGNTTGPGISDNTGSLVSLCPNPFDTETRIRYRVVSPGPVSIEIFDMMGNRVASLVDGTRAPGNYEVVFNPEKEFLSPAAALFFYRYEANGCSESGKLVRAAGVLK